MKRKSREKISEDNRDDIPLDLQDIDLSALEFSPNTFEAMLRKCSDENNNDLMSIEPCIDELQTYDDNNNVSLDDSRQSTAKRLRQSFTNMSICDMITENSEHQSVVSNNWIRCGYIERISLLDFKCHSKLVFEPCSYTNFIFGPNGCGKSAIMDAAILGLGGNSVATGRASVASSSFIKTSSDKATIQITLNNRGPDAYKSAQFGDRITIQRDISKSNHSTYQIINEKGERVSNQKKEIDKILEHFNIQIENSMCFLSQESSKKFLSVCASNPKSNYELFMRASQLESVRSLLARCETERQESLRIIKEKESFLPDLERQLFKLECQHKNSMSYESLRIRTTSLEQEYTYALAREIRQYLKNHTSKKESIVESIRVQLESLNQVERSIESIKIQLAECESKRLRIDELEVNRESLLARRSSCRNKKLGTVKKKEPIIRSIENLEQRKSELEMQLKEEETRHDSPTTQYYLEMKELEAKRNKIKSDMNELADIQLELDKEYADIQLCKSRNSQFLNEMSSRLASREQDKIKLEEKLDSLRMSQNVGKLAKYGRGYVELIKEINLRAREFRDKPIGPIGLYLTVKDPQWTVAIENALLSLLNAFICTNFNDESLLYQLIKKHLPGKPPKVIVARFPIELYDVSNSRPVTREFNTILEMLEIENTQVANALIDLKRIESTLLLPDRDTGRRIIEYNSDKNCSAAYLMNGDSLLGKPTFRSYACTINKPFLLAEETKESQARIEEEFSSCRQDMARLSQQLIKLKTESEEINNRKQDWQRENKEVAVLRMRLENDMKQIENTEIPKPLDSDFYKEEISQVSSELEAARIVLALIDQKIVDLTDEYIDIDNQLEEMDRLILAEDVESVKSLLISIKSNLNEKENQRNALNSLIEKLRSQEAECDREIQQVTIKLDNLSLDQSQSQFETNRSIAEIEQDIKRNKHVLESSGQRLEDAFTINKRYKDALTRFKEIKIDIERQYLFLGKLRDALDVRNRLCDLFKSSRSLQCTQKFTVLLSKLNLSGRLRFDHKQATLDLIVSTDSSSSRITDTASRDDLRNLSGGEKSAATIAFLLALGSITESPILMLDEFDVFMDQNNRARAIELILNAANDEFDSQFIFLTPLQSNFVKSSNERVKYFCLDGPERPLQAPTAHDSEDLFDLIL